MPTLGELRASAMTSLASAFGRSTADAGIRLDVDVLLQKVFSLTKSELYIRGDMDAEAVAAKEFRQLLARRSKYEPIAYLIGQKEFFGFEFSLNSSVLIPRPDTEILVERAIKIAEDFLAKRQSGKLYIVDIGTGSGAILLSILKILEEKVPESVRNQVTACAVDISRDALVVAAKNCAQLAVAAPVLFLQGSLLSAFSFAAHAKHSEIPPYFLVVANPPYVGLSEELMPDVKLFEPPLALFGGEKGWEIPAKLWEDAELQLSGLSGTLLMEIGSGQADTLLSGEKSSSLTVRRLKDLNGVDRALERTFFRRDEEVTALGITADDTGREIGLGEVERGTGNDWT